MIPPFLSEFVRTIVIMSITGGFLVLLLLCLKPMIRHRLPKSAQYVFWLVVLGSLLIPISRIVILPDNAPNITPIHAIVENNVISLEEFESAQSSVSPLNNNVTPNQSLQANEPMLQANEPTAILTLVITFFMLVYPFIVLVVFAHSFFGYLRFVRKLRLVSIQPHETALHMLKNLSQGKKTPKLIVSNYATTPMLIGLFKPTIVLPNLIYTDEQLAGIMLHELTHMRRLDIGVKWLSLAACAFHWFNPLVWLARREIDRVCELACDEAVIRKMDTDSKQSYGETLIAVAGKKKIPLPVFSTTMCSEKKLIKERLVAIMKSKKHTKLAVLTSTLILAAVIFTACALGASSTLTSGEDSDMETHLVTMPDLFDELQPILQPIPFVGAAHETYRIVSAMPLPRSDTSLRSIQIGADHGRFDHGQYTLTVHYNLHGRNMEDMGAAFRQIATGLFGLIEDLQAVTFSIVGEEEADTELYIYRWSISRENSDIGGGERTSFRGIAVNQSNEPVAVDGRIDLRTLMGRQIDDDLLSALGSHETSQGVDDLFYYTFDTGLGIGSTHMTNGIIVSLSVIYNQGEESIRFHFDGLDSASTRDNVIARFGNSPFDIRIEGDNHPRGAVESYGYWYATDSFVRFSFGSSGNLTDISNFFAEMPTDALDERIVRETHGVGRLVRSFEISNTVARIDNDGFVPTFYASAPTTVTTIEVVYAEILRIASVPNDDWGFLRGYPGWDTRLLVAPMVGGRVGESVFMENGDILPLAAGTEFVLETGIYVVVTTEGMDDWFVILVDE